MADGFNLAFKGLKDLLSVMFEDKHVHLLILATKKFNICITQGINGAFLRCHTLRQKYRVHQRIGRFGNGVFLSLA